VGGKHEAVCEMVGRYSLRVECSFEEDQVASASRNVYVHMDPPEPPPERPISVEINARNIDAERARINDGEHVEVQIILKNRRPSVAELNVNASLEDLLFHDRVKAELPPRAQGDQPPSLRLEASSIEVRTDVATDPDVPRVLLEPGRHFVRVDVEDASGAIIANAAKAIWVEVDPEEGGPELPFKMQPRDPQAPSPVWELIAPHGNEPDWVLEYTRTHPAFRGALAADAAASDGQLVGRRYFFGEMICSALVEWAVSLFREHGDESGFQLLLERAQDATEPLWESYRMQLEELQDCSDEVEMIRLTRKIVSLMLYAVQEDLAVA
jgi:hypothetical protein